MTVDFQNRKLSKKELQFTDKTDYFYFFSKILSIELTVNKM